MKYQGSWVILLCLMIAETNEGSPLVSEDPPTGLYYAQFWFDAATVLSQSPLQLMFELKQTGYDTYESSESWVIPGVFFTGVYSSGTKLLTGAWRSTGDDTWGALNYYWNGVTFSGRFSTHGSNATGYEIFYPVNSSFVVPPTPAP